MFEVKRTAPNRIDIDYSGKIDADEMNAALDALLSETEGIENGRMLFRVGEYVLPGFSALKVEAARLPAMLGWIKKFGRCAVLADQGWLKAIAEFEGVLIPGVKIKGFGLDENDAAETWLSED